MAKKAVVDKSLCIGCGTCVSIASKSFKIGADSKAEAIIPPGDSEETLQTAANSCPASAIILEEE